MIKLINYQSIKNSNDIYGKRYAHIIIVTLFLYSNYKIFSIIAPNW